MTLKPAIYRTQEDIECLVQAFENASLSPSEFSHHAHMTVALWYLMRLPYADAVTHMRMQIRKFAARHHQSQLYNETITLFWMKLLRHLLNRAELGTSAADTVYQILTTWGSMLFVFKHYSKELVFSEAAKQSWVEPELRPLGFES
jgi:hypothetical protein